MSLSPEQFIKNGIAKYKWYQPISFGKGLSVNGDFNSSDITSYNFGLGRWNYIIRRNLPDIQGLRVLDIGCNSGLYCVELSRMGAVEVVGVDSERTWPGWREQAQFVKESLEMQCQTKYNIKYYDADMQYIPELDIGRFDMVLALCCIYYIPDQDISDLLKYFFEQQATVLLQGNTVRGEQKGNTAKQAKPRYLAMKLHEAGFPYVWIDKPLFYDRPVIVGTFNDYRLKRVGKKNRLRNWLRMKI